MARTAKSYTIVSITDGALDTLHYANADALKDAIAHFKSDAVFMIFEGESVDFTIDATPRVTLGAAKKPRAKKVEGKARKTKGTTVAPEFFEKSNGHNNNEKQE